MRNNFSGQWFSRLDCPEWVGNFVCGCWEGGLIEVQNGFSDAARSCDLFFVMNQLLFSPWRIEVYEMKARRIILTTCWPSINERFSDRVQGLGCDDKRDELEVQCCLESRQWLITHRSSYVLNNFISVVTCLTPTKIFSSSFRTSNFRPLVRFCATCNCKLFCYNFAVFSSSIDCIIKVIIEYFQVIFALCELTSVYSYAGKCVNSKEARNVMGEGGTHQVWNYRNTIDSIANYRCIRDAFHEITIFSFHREGFLYGRSLKLYFWSTEFGKMFIFCRDSENRNI